MAKPPTMQEIATVASVSRMTVSLALRDSSRVSTKVRKRIRALAKKMGYRPNPLVSALMAQRSAHKSPDAVYPMALINNHGAATTFRKDPLYGTLLRGIEHRCVELGFRAEIFSLRGPGATSAARLHRIFEAQGIRGVIVLPVASEFPELEFPWAHYSAVTLGHTLHSPSLHRAASNQFQNSWTALESARALGYRRLALLLPEVTNARTNYHFTAAFLAFQRYTAGIASIPPCHQSFPDDASRIATWLKRHRPDAIIGYGDFREELAAIGWRVPDDAGYINLNLLKLDHTVSGIDSQIGLVGRAAVDMVVAQLHRNESGSPAQPRTNLVTGRWHAGATTIQSKH